MNLFIRETHTVSLHINRQRAVSMFLFWANVFYPQSQRTNKEISVAELWSERKSGGTERSLEGGEHPCFIMKVCLNMYPYSCLNGSLRIFYFLFRYLIYSVFYVFI